jgi:hypothetical protein
MFLVLTMGTGVAASKGLRASARVELEQIARSSGVTPQVVSVRMNGAPSMVIGKLCAKSPAKAVDIARGFVAAHPALFQSGLSQVEVLNQQVHAMGRTVRLQQLHRGVPVVGAHAALLVDHDGVVRTVSNGFIELGELDTTARIADIDAADTALEASTWFVPSNLEGFYSRLVVLPVHSTFGVLAWELHFGQIPGLLSNLWFYVDAKTGALISQQNRVQNYRGLAFETNPGPANKRESPIQVPLAVPQGGVDYTVGDYDPAIVEQIKTACDYPNTNEAKPDCPEGDAIWLRHPLHMARNCVDYHELVDLDLKEMEIPGLESIQVHFCSEVQTAHADENGDFFFSDWRDGDGNFYDLNPVDKFAEVQMFYHVETIYDYFMSLMDDYEGTGIAQDLEGLAMKPLVATVNFKLPINTNDPGAFTDLMGMLASLSDPNGKLYPYDNAAFIRGTDKSSSAYMPGLSRPYDTIMFGQGTGVDYSWDGDVVYHEFTHAVDNSVTSGGTHEYTEFADEWGINPEPGGMSEGFADTFPAFFTNEPTMGEYSLGFSARDLTGNDVCPNDLSGEVHYDSPMWSQSNYQGREAAVAAVSGSLRTQEARHLYEQATFIGLSSVVADQGYGETAAAILAAVEDLLGSAAKNAAAEAYAAHNTDDCPRIYSDNGTGAIDHNTVPGLGVVMPAAIRREIVPTPYTPGILQWELTVPDGTKALNLSMTVTTDPLGGGMLGGSSGLPDARIIVRHGSAIQFTYQGTTVNTDDDVMGPYALDKSYNFSLIGENGGDLPSGKYYLMAVNQSTSRGAMHSPQLSADDAAMADDKGTHVYGSEPEVPDTDTGDDSTDTGDDSTDTEDGTDQPTTTDDSDESSDTTLDFSSEDQTVDDTGSKKSGSGCAATGRRADASPLTLLFSALGL